MLAAQLSLLPNWTFVAELILFLIVLGVIAKWILPPIKGAIDERQRRVRSSLSVAEEERAEAERLAVEREHVLAAARDEARRLLEASRHRVDEVRSEARERAEQERQRRLTQALTAFEREVPGIRAAALADIEPLVAAAAEHVLGAPIDVGRHREAITSLVSSEPSVVGAER